MATKLKPCPFCGHEPDMGAVATYEAPANWLDAVGCYNNRCTVQPQALASSPAVAARRWNRRKPLRGTT